MALFVASLIGLLITVIIWKPTAWGLLPADKIRPRYAIFDVDIRLIYIAASYFSLLSKDLPHAESSLLVEVLMSIENGNRFVLATSMCLLGLADIKLYL